MPNWCKNFLRVNGPKKDLARFVKRAAPAKTNGQTNSAPPSEAFSFQRLVPLPAASQAGTDDEESISMEQWGCLGDAAFSESEESRYGTPEYRFATAWDPPMAFLREVSNRWPTLEFVLNYDEAFMAFYGTVRAYAGRITHFHIEL